MKLPPVSDTGQTVVLLKAPVTFVLTALSFKIKVFPASIHTLVWNSILQTQSERIHKSLRPIIKHPKITLIIKHLKITLWTTYFSLNWPLSSSYLTWTRCDCALTKYRPGSNDTENTGWGYQTPLAKSCSDVGDG